MQPRQLQASQWGAAGGMQWAVQAGRTTAGSLLMYSRDTAGTMRQRGTRNASRFPMGAWILPYSQCFDYADLHGAWARVMRHSKNVHAGLA